MDGITSIKKDKYSIIYIECLSEEFKDSIREHLALMCHGKDEVDSGHIYANYKTTLKEFNKRLNEKSDKQKKGQIGELLTHLIIRTELPDYEICSPLFNMEERSAKKGFDLIIIKEDELWLNEVKSGEASVKEKPNTKINNLIKKAADDLIERVDNKDKALPLWMEAINGARKIVSDKNGNKKNAIIEILQKSADNASSCDTEPLKYNVILSGVLFNNISNKFEENIIKEKYAEIDEMNAFQSLFVIAIQEQAYQDVVQFLEDEVDYNE